MPLTGLWVPDIWSNIIWYFWEGVWDESNTWETAEGRFPSLISWRSEQDKKVDSPKKRECLISNVFKLGRHMFPAFRFQLKYQLSSWDFNSWSLYLCLDCKYTPGFPESAACRQARDLPAPIKMWTSSRRKYIYTHASYSWHFYGETWFSYSWFSKFPKIPKFLKYI